MTTVAAGAPLAAVLAADAAARRRHRRNNFDAIRLFAAIVVIYGHGCEMAGFTLPGFWGAPFAKLGLDIFFSISGYLVTRSWDGQPRLMEFALKRALRLMPGLIVCVLLTALLLGPLMTSLPLGHYVLRWHSWSYLLNIALYLQLYLPGVFTDLREGGAVNGSLWSLFPEVLCYLTVPMLWRLRPRRRRAALLAGALATGGASVYLFHAPRAPIIGFYSMSVDYALQEVPFFFMGALLSLLDRERPRFYRVWAAALLFAAGDGLSHVYGWRAAPLEWLLLPYLVIGFGRLSTPLVNRASVPGDLSYGTYLYAFPIQQTLLALFPHLHHPIRACVLVTLPIAWLSWHLVEKPALLLRLRLPWLVTECEMAARQVDLWAAQGLRATPGLLRRGAVTAWRLLPTPALPLVLASAIVLVFLGQLPLGRWQSDEFQLFADQHLWGWRFLPARLSYSPRPLSEALLFGYGWLVLHLHGTLVVPFLGALWLGTLAAAIAALRHALPHGPWRGAVAATLPLATFAFVLATNDLTEFFFWPAAAAAYMPTAAAPLLLLFLLSRPASRRRDLACGLALLAAALSSEVGAAFALAFAGAALLEWATRPRSGVRRGAFAAWGWWAIPGLAAAAVMAQIARVRVHIVELGAGTQALTGHPVAAGRAALWQMLHDLAGGAGPFTAGAWPAALVAKLAFAAGLVAVWRWASPGGVRLGRMGAVLACALLACVFFSVFSALLHYGAVCCERQSTTRFWMIDVLAVVTMLAAPAATLPKLPRWTGPALLAASLLPVFWRLGGIRADYDNLTFAAQARMKTWVSASRPADGAMQFYLPPDGQDLLVRGTAQPIGHVLVAPPGGTAGNGMIDAVGRFYGRRAVDVCEPWQTGQSWLYYGHFIPACPPHDGPPDRIFPPPPNVPQH